MASRFLELQIGHHSDGDLKSSSPAMSVLIIIVVFLAFAAVLLYLVCWLPAANMSKCSL